MRLSNRPHTSRHDKMKKQDLRIVFFGTPEFAVASLDRLVSEGYNIVGAVTMPDKPAGRGHKLYSSPVKEYAVAHNIPLLQPVKLKDPEFLEQLRALDGTLFIVIAFRMLPEAVWQMPPMGTFNLHASLLPRYRGAAPINWAVINGDRETGVTTFFLKHEIDTGDIIAQERIAIDDADNVGDVHDKLMNLGAELTLDTVEHIISGDLRPIPQSELLNGEEPTPAPKIFKDTCHIDWHKSASAVHNLVRGLSPYPAAWTDIADADNPEAPSLTVKIFRTSVAAPAPDPSLPDGTVIADNNRMTVKCGDNGMIEILELQPAGKRRMATAEFLRGARLPQHPVLK